RDRTAPGRSRRRGADSRGGGRRLAARRGTDRRGRACPAPRSTSGLAEALEAARPRGGEGLLGPKRLDDAQVVVEHEDGALLPARRFLERRVLEPAVTADERVGAAQRADELGAR